MKILVAENSPFLRPEWPDMGRRATHLSSDDEIDGTIVEKTFGHVVR